MHVRIFPQRLERRAEGGQEFLRQAGAGVERRETRAAEVAHKARDLLLAKAGKLAKRGLEKFAVAREQRAQHEARGQLFRGAQMRDEIAHALAPVALGGVGDDDDIGLVARFAGEPLGPFGRQPAAIGDEGGETGRRRIDEIVAHRGGEPGAREQRLAHLAVVAEALDHATHRKFGKIGAGIDGKRNRRLAHADLGQRRADAGGHAGAQRDRALRKSVADRGAVDEFGFGQERRAREDRRRDVGLVACKRGDDGARRLDRAGEIVGERPAHERRGIVEKRGEGDFRFAARLGVEIGVKIGARQRAGAFRPLRR